MSFFFNSARRNHHSTLPPRLFFFSSCCTSRAPGKPCATTAVVFSFFLFPSSSIIHPPPLCYNPFLPVALLLYKQGDTASIEMSYTGMRNKKNGQSTTMGLPEDFRPGRTTRTTSNQRRTANDNEQEKTGHLPVYCNTKSWFKSLFSNIGLARITPFVWSFSVSMIRSSTGTDHPYDNLVPFLRAID